MSPMSEFTNTYSVRRERTQKVVKDIKEAIVLSDEDASVLEIVLGILLVNSFEISIYDREQEIRSSTDSSIQGSQNGVCTC